MHPQGRRFLDAGENVFATLRFSARYQRWLKRGDAVFEGQSSPVIAGVREPKTLRMGLRRGPQGGRYVRTPSTPCLNPVVAARAFHRDVRWCSASAQQPAATATTCTPGPRVEWGGVLCRPVIVGVSAGTEPRRERPRSPRASAAPCAPTGSVTSRFRVSSSEREVRAAASQISGRRAARNCT